MTAPGKRQPIVCWLNFYRDATHRSTTPRSDGQSLHVAQIPATTKITIPCEPCHTSLTDRALASLGVPAVPIRDALRAFPYSRLAGAILRTVERDCFIDPAHYVIIVSTVLLNERKAASGRG